MKPFRGFCTAFSLYSIMPMPSVQWKHENMQYALCFFPLVGVVIGVMQWGWMLLADWLDLSVMLFAAVAVLLPLLLTGGIHMDGLMDTMDAVGSHAGRERRLEILKDPHAGAFAVIGCAGYLLLQFGLWCQIYSDSSLFVLAAAGYLLSRALNAMSIAAFPCARTSGLVHTFSTAAARKTVTACCFGYGLLAWGICAFISPVYGTLFVVLALLYFVWHRNFCIKGFGGNTGDLAGFLLMNVETASLIFAAIGGKLS